MTCALAKLTQGSQVRFHGWDNFEQHHLQEYETAYAAALNAAVSSTVRSVTAQQEPMSGPSELVNHVVPDGDVPSLITTDHDDNSRVENWSATSDVLIWPESQQTAPKLTEELNVEHATQVSVPIPAAQAPIHEHAGSSTQSPIISTSTTCYTSDYAASTDSWPTLTAYRQECQEKLGLEK